MTITVKSGSTLTPTGGSDVVYTKTNEKADGSLVYKDLTQTDLRIQKKVEVKSSDAKTLATAPNGYTQQKNSVSFLQPKLLANGKFTTNGIDVSLHFDVETTEAERIQLLDAVAIFCTNVDSRKAMTLGSALA